MLTDNYVLDLYKSLHSPLLIEINRTDLDSFLPPYGIKLTENLPLYLASKIYNKEQKSNESNIIVVEANSNTPDNRFIILEALLRQLNQQLKDIKNAEALLKVTQGGLNILTGGLLDSIAGEYLDKGVEFIFDQVSEFVSDAIIDFSEYHLSTSNILTDWLSGVLIDSSGELLASKVVRLKEADLHLSEQAKSKLAKLSSEFKKSNTNDIFQLAFKLLLTVCNGSPKLIWVKNPQYLDVNSIELLSLLLAHSKHNKDLSDHIGLSIIYQYSENEFQPYKDVQAEYKSKQVIIDSQRGFAQRYGMLERPTHDMPVVAVKATTFVGRESELKRLMEQFYKRKPGFISVVSGEPGIGKTTLIRHHISSVQRNKRCISLSLINEVGNTSTNTGLSSLETSIIEETNRLAALSKWKVRSKDYLKEQLNIENSVKVISSIFGVSITGLDKLVSTSAKLFERYEVDSSVAKMNAVGQQELNNQNDDIKQLQFKKIDKAIEALKSLADENQPIVLFVDDIQWIDDCAAEYILTRLTRHDFYIIISVRPSDAATIFSSRLSNDAVTSSYYKSVNSLFTLLKITGFEKVNVTPFSKNKIEINSPDLDGQSFQLYIDILALKGLNEEMLQEILSRIIQGDKSKLNALSLGIMKALKGNDGTQLNDTINTLFAIETINMLCDESFYKENNALDMIQVADDIDKLNKTLPFKLNHEIENFSIALENTFSRLQEKYKSSLSHFNSVDLHSGYSLMAYAVMEERLNLIRIYFGRFGNSAVYSLLFSSLLGVPFLSRMIQNVLEEIIYSKGEELEPIRNLLPSKIEYGVLKPEHYAVLDEVYEILKRFPNQIGHYTYKHGLLKVFFNQQLRFILNSLNTSNISNESSVTAYSYLLRTLNKVIDDEIALIYERHNSLVAMNKSEFFIIVKLSVAEFFVDFNRINSDIAEQYLSSTILIVRCFLDVGKGKEALETLLSLEKRISSNEIVYISSNQMPILEGIYFIRAHVYGRENSEDFGQKSLDAYKELNNIRTQYYGDIDNCHKTYASNMSEVTENLRRKMISKSQAYIEYTKILEQVTTVKKINAFERMRLLISLLLNMSGSTSDESEQENKLLAAHDLAKEFYDAQGDHVLKTLLEVEQNLVSYWLNSKETTKENQICAYKICLHSYELISQIMRKEVYHFDNFYYPCVFRLLTLKAMCMKDKASLSTSENDLKLLLSKIDALQLPSLDELSKSFLSLKVTNPKLYDTNKGRYELLCKLSGVVAH